MLRRILEAFRQKPKLEGLENVLSKVASGQLGIDDASRQIRRLPTASHYPPWLPRAFRLTRVSIAVFGICYGCYNIVFAIGTNEASGIVTKMVTRMDGDMQGSSPVVDFEVNNKIHTFQSPISSSPPAYCVGDTVKVIYHPGNPNSAQINSFHERWLFPVAFSSFGIVTIIGSYLVPRFMFNVKIRPETFADRKAIWDLNCAAFETEAEADLVDALRAGGHLHLLLVAEVNHEVVGHVLFSKLLIVTNTETVEALSLAPMAVMPSHQHRGIGSRLVVEGLDECRRNGNKIVVVLGHPDFYVRFGFSTDLAKELDSPFGGGDAWMAMELVPRSMTGIAGRVEYPPPFMALM